VAHGYNPTARFQSLFKIREPERRFVRALKGRLGHYTRPKGRLVRSFGYRATKFG